MSTIREVFKNQSVEDNPNYNNPEQKTEKDYRELAKKIEDMAVNNKEIAQQLAEIHKSISKVQEESFKMDEIDRLLKSVPARDLCDMAIEQYVGSITSPKNEQLMKMYLEYANKNAITDEDKLEIEYYTIYLRKLTAIQTGNKQEFEAANEDLIKLCNEKEHKIAMHIVAKELYKLGLNIMNSKYKKAKKDYLNGAIELFTKAVEKGSYHSLYYLGEMAEKGDIPGGIDLNLAFEYYLIAASHDNAQAYFRLAQFYKNGIIEKKNPDLEYLYTNKAAELGLTEAQHNLGCMYLENRIVKYDSLKAIAWFSHAGAAGFVHSQYNAAKLYIEGGNDGKVKVNYNAAMVWLDSIQKHGHLDVDKLINDVHKLMDQEEEQLEKIKGFKVPELK